MLGIVTTLNPFTTGHTPVCGWRFKHADNIIVHVEFRKHFFKIFENSEAETSELLENLDEMFTRYVY